MHPVMNYTKWDEIRLAMYGLGELKPRWRTRCIDNGYESEWDRDWFYHFRIPNDRYRSIEWLEIAVDSDEQRIAVLESLTNIHVPGEATACGFKIFGYVSSGATVDYLDRSNPQLQRTPSAPLT
jgi:hypothetical protein